MTEISSKRLIFSTEAIAFLTQSQKVLKIASLARIYEFLYLFCVNKLMSIFTNYTSKFSHFL